MLEEPRMSGEWPFLLSEGCRIFVDASSGEGAVIGGTNCGTLQWLPIVRYNEAKARLSMNRSVAGISISSSVEGCGWSRYRRGYRPIVVDCLSKPVWWSVSRENKRDGR